MIWLVGAADAIVLIPIAAFDPEAKRAPISPFRRCEVYMFTGSSRKHLSRSRWLHGAVPSALCLLAPAPALATLYLDNNGSTAGFGSVNGTVDFSDPVWTTSSAGTSTPGAFASGHDVIFAAGGVAYALNTNSARSVLSLEVISASPNVTVNSGGGGFTFSGTGATGNITVASSKTFTISTNLNSGNTSGGITKLGTGTLSLSGSSNAYTGNTTISSGTLSLGGGDNRLPDTTQVLVNGGALNIGSRSDTVAGVRINGGNVNGTTGVLTSTSTFDARNGSASAVLAGNVGLNKTTTGTVTLTGANLYTGTTSASDGVLLLNNATGSATGTGGISVTGTATLGGNGFVVATNANVTIGATAKLSPGAAALAAGTLSLNLGTGSLDIGSASTRAVYADASASLLFDLQPALADQVALLNPASSLNIGSGVLEFNDFVFNVTGELTNGSVFVLFDTAAPITGSLGSSLTGSLGGTTTGTISIAPNGQDVLLTVAVPEPAISGALVTSAGLLIRRRRR